MDERRAPSAAPSASAHQQAFHGVAPAASFAAQLPPPPLPTPPAMARHPFNNPLGAVNVAPNPFLMSTMQQLSTLGAVPSAYGFQTNAALAPYANAFGAMAAAPHQDLQMQTAFPNLAAQSWLNANAAFNSLYAPQNQLKHIAGLPAPLSLSQFRDGDLGLDAACPSNHLFAPNALPAPPCGRQAALAMVPNEPAPYPTSAPCSSISANSGGTRLAHTGEASMSAYQQALLLPAGHATASAGPSSSPGTSTSSSARRVAPSINAYNAAVLNPVDALEEALSTLSREYNLDAETELGEMPELNDRLLHDAFFGVASGAPQPEPTGGALDTSGSLLHSILEYDPSTLQPHNSAAGPSSKAPLDVSEPAGTALVAAADSAATPKLREKMKLKREKELAEIDKAFDRHLCLVAEKNARYSGSLGEASVPVASVSPHCESSTSALSPADGAAADPLSPVRFSPVQFSPGSSCSNDDAPFPSSSAFSDDVQIFLPKSDEADAKSLKVPVYKQDPQNKLHEEPRRLSTRASPTTDRASGAPNALAEDEYSFVDDEDDSAGGAVGMQSADEKRVEEEVAKKLLQISSLHPELKAAGQYALARRQVMESNLFSGANILSRAAAATPSTSAQPNAAELWKHVVPKKRHAAGAKVTADGDAPAAPLLPPCAGGEHSAKVGCVAEKELSPSAQLSERFRRRQEARRRRAFVHSEIIADDGSTVQPVVDVKKELPDAQLTNGDHAKPRPKVIIRISKACLSAEPKKSKKRHKHHKDKHSDGRKKKKKHKHDRRYEENDSGRRRSSRSLRRRRSSSDDSDYEDPAWRPVQKATTTPSDAKAPSMPVPMKQRIIDVWKKSVANDATTAADEAASDSDDASTSRRAQSAWCSISPACDEAAATESRLAQLRQKPDALLQKGKFVVAKSDVGRSDCPIWKVDNQNLLQKFPPREENGRIVYESSSTYSGWCEQNTDSYLVVHVRYLKHTRAQCIVEPDIAVLDLFPAISSELTGGGGELLTGGARSPPECDQHAAPADSHQPLRDALDTYVHALVLHCLSGHFLHTIRLQNEWKFLRHMNDVDALNAEKRTKLLAAVGWADEFGALLEAYSSCATTADADLPDVQCQACGAAPAERTVQLYSIECYDADSLEPHSPRHSPGANSPLQAQESLVCCACADKAAIYHRLFHMRYHMFKRCEQRVDLIREDNPEMDPSDILQNVLKCRWWLDEVIRDYIQLWKTVVDDSSFRLPTL